MVCYVLRWCALDGRDRGFLGALRRNRAALILIAAGAAMIAFGVFSGEVTTVFMKAKSICLECIGIG